MEPVDPVIPQDVIREETREEEKKPDGTIRLPGEHLYKARWA